MQTPSRRQPAEEERATAYRIIHGGAFDRDTAAPDRPPRASTPPPCVWCVQIPREVQRLFTQQVVVLNSTALQRPPWSGVAQEARKFIDELGRRSAIAQGLVSRNNVPNPITTVASLPETKARIYLMAAQAANGAVQVVGLLKVGHKQLYHWDAQGRTRELPDQFCVLDFFVHEDYQRGGYGKALFQAMLQNESVQPHQLAYDRPSPKLIGFMRKHYGLTDYVPQQNKFVIFNDFFQNRPVKTSIYDSIQDRPLTARGAGRR